MPILSQNSAKSLARLQHLLRSNHRSSALVGLGNELLGDDAVGLHLVRALREKLPPSVLLVEAGTVPENITGELIRQAPALTLFIDALHADLRPGEISIQEEESITNSSFSTHSLPLPVLLSYLRASYSSSFAIVGVQVEQTTFGAQLSAAVNQALASTAQAIVEAFIA